MASSMYVNKTVFKDIYISKSMATELFICIKKSTRFTLTRDKLRQYGGRVPVSFTAFHYDVNPFYTKYLITNDQRRSLIKELRSALSQIPDHVFLSDEECDRYNKLTQDVVGSTSLSAEDSLSGSLSSGFAVLSGLLGPYRHDHLHKDASTIASDVILLEGKLYQIHEKLVTTQPPSMSSITIYLVSRVEIMPLNCISYLTDSMIEVETGKELIDQLSMQSINSNNSLYSGFKREFPDSGIWKSNLVIPTRIYSTDLISLGLKADSLVKARCYNMIIDMDGVQCLRYAT